jgi:hypothetical protein
MIGTRSYKRNEGIKDIEENTKQNGQSLSNVDRG